MLRGSQELSLLNPAGDVRYVMANARIKCAEVGAFITRKVLEVPRAHRGLSDFSV